MERAVLHSSDYYRPINFAHTAMTFHLDLELLFQTDDKDNDEEYDDEELPTLPK